jgi:hypothetical protein
LTFFKNNLKPRHRVTCYAEALARGQLAELHFWKFRKVFPYQSNSQNFFKFHCHFLGRHARGVFPVPLAFAKKFSSFADWLKNGRVLRGSGRGGLNPVSELRKPYAEDPFLIGRKWGFNGRSRSIHAKAIKFSPSGSIETET